MTKTKFCRLLLLPPLMGAAWTGRPAMAQDMMEADAGDAIVVTGTRAPGRSVADSTVPIDVISAEALDHGGYTETNRLLGQLVPSFNFPQPSITDGTDTVRPASLRGLSPDQSLVLINGKRRHTTALLNINGSVGRGSAAVDINLIPAIALSRVEVLRDGAAAQYGSDAIAGVINFQLSDMREGGRITMTYGRYETQIEGIERVTGLATDAQGQPIVQPDGTFALAHTGKDRTASDGATLTLAGIVGLPLGADGHLTLAAEYQDRNPTNRTGYDPRRQYAPRADGSIDPREFSFDRLSHRYGDAATKDMKLFANAGLPIGDAAELYAWGSYNFRDGTSGGLYRRADDARNVADIYPDGFLPLINTSLDDIALTAGVRGEIGDGWRYDLSAGTAKNSFDFFITDTLNRSFGSGSQRAFDSGGLRYTQTTANLDLARTLAPSFLEELTIAGGLEYRRETFRLRAGDAGSYAAGPFGGAAGAQGFPGIAPVIGGAATDQLQDRHNVSAYLELDAKMSDAFSIQMAGRYEDYSDFGSDWNGKLAARFEPVRGVALRGAIATGFRAPSLQQQYYASSATNNVGGVLLETVTLPVGNPIARALGATALEPETSLSYSAGLVIDALPGLGLTIDLYQIHIDDRIVVTDNLVADRAAGAADPGRAIAAILDAAGFASTNAARFFVNGVDTRTRGLDAVATYRFALAGGRVTATAGFNYNKTRIERVLAAPGPLANIPGLVLFGRQESLRLTDGQPRTKLNLALDYEQDGFGATIRTNRYGKVLAAGVDPFTDVALGARWITDIELRVPAGDQIDLALGVNNLFDVYPTIAPTGSSTDPATGNPRAYPATNYVAPWSNFSPFGFNGRFVYARVALRF